MREPNARPTAGKSASVKCSCFLHPAERTVKLNFSFAGRSSRLVPLIRSPLLETQSFSGATFEIEWGDRVALVGPTVQENHLVADDYRRRGAEQRRIKSGTV